MSGPHREGEESKPMKHGQEKSDLFIIALKPTNKPGRLGTELVEPRERTEGNMGEQHTYRTLRRIKRVPEARLCTRSCSWDSSLTTRGGSPVRESRPPGSVRGASSNGCPYRDRRIFSSRRFVLRGSAFLMTWASHPPGGLTPRVPVKRAVIGFWGTFRIE